jgi:hypothetical protein
VANNIRDLRKHLFETIEALKDPDKPMDVNRAKAISSVAQTIINSAKLEVQYLRATDSADQSEFLIAEEQRKKPALPATAPPRKGLETGKNLGADPATKPS